MASSEQLRVGHEIVLTLAALHACDIESGWTVSNCFKLFSNEANLYIGVAVFDDIELYPYRK